MPDERVLTEEQLTAISERIRVCYGRKTIQNTYEFDQTGILQDVCLLVLSHRALTAKVGQLGRVLNLHPDTPYEDALEVVKRLFAGQHDAAHYKARLAAAMKVVEWFRAGVKFIPTPVSLRDFAKVLTRHGSTEGSCDATVALIDEALAIEQWQASEPKDALAAFEAIASQGTGPRDGQAGTSAMKG